MQKVLNIYVHIFIFKPWNDIREHQEESDILLSKGSSLQRTLLPKTSYLVIYRDGVSETELPVSCKSSLNTIRTIELKKPQISSFLIFPVTSWIILPYRTETLKSNFSFIDFRPAGAQRKGGL